MMQRRNRGALAAIVLLALGGVACGDRSTEGDVDNAGSGAGTEPISPVLVPIVDSDEPFVIEYREGNLGAEMTGRDGGVIQEAELESRSYRLTYTSDQTWTIESLDGQVRDQYDNGLFRSWRDGELVGEQPFEALALPVRMAMPLAVRDFHAHVAELGFTQTERSASGDSTVSEVYERELPMPEGEYYRTLPWRENGNVEQVSIEIRKDDNRILAYTERINGQVTYEYELTSGP